MRTTGKQRGLAATGDYQPSLRSPWLAALELAPTLQTKIVHAVGPSGGPEALYKLEQTDPQKVRFSLRNPNGAWAFDISADAKTFSITKVGVGEMLSVNDSGQMFLRGVQIH